MERHWSAYSLTPKMEASIDVAISSDTARDIYRNATLEHVALVRILAKRESEAEARMGAWENQLSVSPSF